MALIFQPEGERPDILLENDRQQGTLRDNYYRQLGRYVPSPEPSLDGWLNEKYLGEKIKEAINSDQISIDLSDWVSELPSIERIEEICHEVELQLGLSIDFETSINGTTRNLLIY